MSSAATAVGSLTARLVGLRKALAVSNEARLLCEEEMSSSKATAQRAGKAGVGGSRNAAATAAASRAAAADVRLLSLVTGEIEQGDDKAAALGIAASLLAAPQQEVAKMLTAPTEVRVESGTVLSSVLLTGCIVDTCGHPNPDVAASGLRACLEIAEQAAIDEDGGEDAENDDDDAATALGPATMLIAALAHRGLLGIAVDVMAQHSSSAASGLPDTEALACVVAAVQLVRKLLGAVPTALADVCRTCRQLASVLSVAAGAIVACSVAPSEVTDDATVAADDFFDCFEEAADALVDVCTDYGLVALAAGPNPSPAVTGMVGAIVNAGVAVAGAAQAIVGSATAPASLAEAAESVVTMAHDVMDVTPVASSSSLTLLQTKPLEAVAVAALAAATSQPGLSAAQRVFGWECVALVVRRCSASAEVAQALAEARVFALIGPVIDSAVAGAEVVGKRRRSSDDFADDAEERDGPAATTARLCTALAQLIAGLWTATGADAALRGRMKGKLVACGATSAVSRLDALCGAVAAVGNDRAVGKALQQVRAALP